MRRFLAGLVAVLWSAATVFAVEQQHDGGGHGAAHAPEIGDVFLPLINFILFAFLIWRFAWPAIRANLSARREVVQSTLGEAERSLAAATSDLGAIRRQHENLDAEGRRILDDLR